MRYQFCVDGRPASPIRKNWMDAAWDAVNHGYATWNEMNYSLFMDSNMGASIERLEDASIAA